MQVITHSQFMQLIHPSWPEKMTIADKRAVLKRNNVILQSDEWIYIRWAGEGHSNVPRFPVPRKYT